MSSPVDVSASRSPFRRRVAAVLVVCAVGIASAAVLATRDGAPAAAAAAVTVPGHLAYVGTFDLEGVRPAAIRIHHFEQSVLNPRSDTATGKATMEPFVVVKDIDAASPVLAQAAASGVVYRRATIALHEVIHGQARTVGTWELDDVRIVGDQQVAGDTPTGGPAEVVSLHAAKYSWTFGHVKTGRDFVANKNL